jgi:hypothetical protein
MIEFELWPEALRRAVATRDAAVKPLMSTIESLDVSWTVVQGNFGELMKTIDAFAGRDSATTIAVWKQSPLAKHRYHLEVVRRFHNFLSAAVAYLYHSERSLRKFKALVGETYAEWQQRHDTVRDHLYFLEHLRDFSIHSGTHQSVLTLRFTEAGQPFGEVGFSVQPVLADLEAKNPRSTRDRWKLQAMTTTRRPTYIACGFERNSSASIPG